MATVDITVGAITGHPGRRGKRTPYFVRRVFTAADAVAAKGGVLATADVIETIDLPAETVVMAAGLEVTTADSGTAAPMDLGVTGADPNQWVAAYAATTAGVAPAAATPPIHNVGLTADTLDILLGTLSAANDDWVVEIWAMLVDASSYVVAASAKENFA